MDPSGLDFDQKMDIGHGVMRVYTVVVINMETMLNAESREIVGFFSLLTYFFQNR